MGERILTSEIKIIIKHKCLSKSELAVGCQVQPAYGCQHIQLKNKRHISLFKNIINTE